MELSKTTTPKNILPKKKNTDTGNDTSEKGEQYENELKELAKLQYEDIKDLCNIIAETLYYSNYDNRKQISFLPDYVKEIIQEKLISISKNDEELEFD